MEIEILAERMDGKIRRITECTTDSPGRAIQMYDNEDYLYDDERIAYRIIS